MHSKNNNAPRIKQWQAPVTNDFLTDIAGFIINYVILVCIIIIIVPIAIALIAVIFIPFIFIVIVTIIFQYYYLLFLFLTVYIYHSFCNLFLSYLHLQYLFLIL